MPDPVKTRPYDATRRRAAAQRTRGRVLLAARDLFLTKGYAATPVAAVARHAGVSVDTVSSSVGRKPALLLAVHDMELAEGDASVAAEQPDYVRAVRAAPPRARRSRRTPRPWARVLPRTVQLQRALRDAARSDPECGAQRARISERRAANVRLFAADLRATGELPPDLDDDRVADLV